MTLNPSKQLWVVTAIENDSQLEEPDYETVIVDPPTTATRPCGGTVVHRHPAVVHASCTFCGRRCFSSPNICTCAAQCRYGSCCAYHGLLRLPTSVAPSRATSANSGRPCCRAISIYTRFLFFLIFFEFFPTFWVFCPIEYIQTQFSYLGPSRLNTHMLTMDNRNQSKSHIHTLALSQSVTIAHPINLALSRGINVYYQIKVNNWSSTQKNIITTIVLKGFAQTFFGHKRRKRKGKR